MRGWGEEVLSDEGGGGADSGESAPCSYPKGRNHYCKDARGLDERAKLQIWPSAEETGLAGYNQKTCTALGKGRRSGEGVLDR